MDIVKVAEGYPSLTQIQYYNINIVLPDKECQDTIVDKLEFLENSILKYETSIKDHKVEKEIFKKYSRNLDIKALLNDAEIKKIDEIMNVTCGKGQNDRSKAENDEYNMVATFSYIAVCLTLCFLVSVLKKKTCIGVLQSVYNSVRELRSETIS